MATLPPLPTLTFDPYKIQSMESGIVDFSKVALEKDGRQRSNALFSKPSTQIDKPKVVHAIVNFFGGGGGYKSQGKIEALGAFTRALKEEKIDIEIMETLSAGHGVELAQQIPETCELLVVWGGDGTVQEVVTGLMTRSDQLRVKCPIALVCAGSGSVLATAIGLRKKKWSLKENALRVAQAICQGKTQMFDLQKTAFPNSPPVYSALIMSWGNTTSLFLDADKMRTKYGLGESRYVFAMLYRMFIKNYPERPRVRLIVDDAYELELPKCWLEWKIYPNEITVANSSIMQGYQMSPLAQADDGKFESNVSPRYLGCAQLRTAVKLALSNRHIVGQPQEHQRPIYFRFSKLRVEWHPDSLGKRGETDGMIALDGTLQSNLQIPFEIECVPGAIRLIVA